MRELRGSVTEKAEERFRKLAMKKFGYCKGSLSKALEEAVDNWIKYCEAEFEASRLANHEAKT